MELKPIKKQLLQLHYLSGKCGYFSINNNSDYGCNVDVKIKSYPGCCYGFDCPFAYEAHIEDLHELDQRLYEEYQNNDSDIDGSGWVVRYCEEIK